VTSIATYRSSRELFTNLTLRELRSKYKRSFLGWAWSLVNPLAIMVVYTIVFKYFLRIKVNVGEPSGLNVFALFLLCGLLPWNFFQNSVSSCISSLTGNSALIKKTYFPRDLLPGATVGAALVTHAIEMGLLLVAVVAFGNYRALEYVPLLVLLTFTMVMFSLGLGLTLSALNVYFRDIEHLMTIVFLLWLYMTPIIYPFSVVPERFQTIVKLNPMTDASLCYRDMLYDGTHPGWGEFAYFGLWAVFLMVSGLLVFNRLEGRLAEEL
jgi:ABC-type polysaccharide/polyol phosphate export permease